MDSGAYSLTDQDLDIAKTRSLTPEYSIHDVNASVIENIERGKLTHGCSLIFN